MLSVVATKKNGRKSSDQRRKSISKRVKDESGYGTEKGQACNGIYERNSSRLQNIHLFQWKLEGVINGKIPVIIDITGSGEYKVN